MDDDSKPAQILPGLFIGTLKHSLNKNLLFDLDITHILSVGEGMDEEFPFEFEYHIVDILDMEDQNILKHFNKCYKFIEDGREIGACLVHWYQPPILYIFHFSHFRSTQ
jgi:dual specificity phosphatase 12